tara:strand:- start:220 stop:402 length:183 start_codon:yes stop_codon:yes gene_type:complete
VFRTREFKVVERGGEIERKENGNKIRGKGKENGNEIRGKEGKENGNEIRGKEKQKEEELF